MTEKVATGSLLASGTAGVLASACCAGPLILVSLGVGGAWVGNLAALEPYRWIFVGVAVAALVFAWRRIYRPAPACAPGTMCAAPGPRRVYKTAFWIVAALVALGIAFPYLVPLFF